MKKIIKIMIMLILAVSACLSVSADLIVGPQKDEFYQDHKGEISSVVRIFEAKKNIEVMKSPESDEVLGVIRKGKVVRVDFSYTDENGQLWGMQKLDDAGVWFEMKHMMHVKDYIDFWDEHPKMKSSTEIIRFDQEGYLILWEYPNSDLIASAPPTSVLDREHPIKGGVEYIDENGIRWVSVAIDFRTYIGWLNMSEPISSTIPDEVGYEIDLSQTQISAGDSMQLLVGGLTIGVCALTGVLVWLKKKQK